MSLSAVLSLFFGATLLVGTIGAGLAQIWKRKSRPPKPPSRFEIVAIIQPDPCKDRSMKAIDESIHYLDPDYKQKKK